MNNDGILFKRKDIDEPLSKAVLVLTHDFIPQVLKFYHDSQEIGGHFGIKKTYNKIKSKFLLKNMKFEIEKFIRSCHLCQLNQKALKEIGKMKPILIEKFEP